MTERFVLILTNRNDLAADLVVTGLGDLGVGVLRLNVEDARSKSVPPWSPSDRKRVWPGLCGVWWRQFQLDCTFESVFEADDEIVRQSQWRAWISVLETSGVPWVNPVWAARRAENKIVQLQCASDLGARVPQTVVTNDPEVAQAFRSEHGRCVVKSLSSGYFALSDRAFVYTQELTDEIFKEARAAWLEQPLIVQEFVGAARADARVIAFGEHCFGARHPRTTIDWRTTPEAQWSVWAVPTSIAAFCRRYNKKMGLAYAAFDFLVADDDVWFLEANQAGEWAFLDRALGLGISDALAGHLASLVHLGGSVMTGGSESNQSADAWR